MMVMLTWIDDFNQKHISTISYNDVPYYQRNYIVLDYEICEIHKVLLPDS